MAEQGKLRRVGDRSIRSSPMSTKVIWLVVLLPTLMPLAGAGAAAAGDAPDGWRLVTPRDELAPRAWVVRGADGKGAGYGLALAGNGERSVDGRWVRRVPVTAGTHVRFDATYVATDVETPTRSVVASVLWFDASGNQVERAEFPTAKPQSKGRPEAGTDAARVTAMYRVPDGATEAQIELRLRWAPKGDVVWRDVGLAPAETPAARRVKVASVNHRPRGTKSPRENLEQFAKFIGEAGKAGADVACLPEGVTICGTNLSYADVAEAVPGPTTEFLGAAAKDANAYVIAGLYEREGKAVYNTSVLIGRDGKLIGKYRKVCLPREEIDGGITPGTEYPVFDTDIGRVGMMICWDVSYPEVARELAAGGAEIIFLPIWGGHETLARARAIENQVYLVCSGYDFRTAIYDKAGEALARSPSDQTSEVIYAEFDLGERLMWPWLGDWRSRIFMEGPAREGVGR
jgi:predicted amidohydrolase